MLDIVYKYWKQRMRECKRCEYRRHWMGKLDTCGSFAVGDIVVVNGEEKKLCGCILQLKAKLERSECPLNKWKDVDGKD